METTHLQIGLLAYLQHDTEQQPFVAQNLHAKMEDLYLYLTNKKDGLFDFLAQTCADELLFDKLIALRLNIFDLLASEDIDSEAVLESFYAQLTNFITVPELQNLHDNIEFAARTQLKVLVAQAMIDQHGSFAAASKATFTQAMPLFYKQYMAAFQIAVPHEKLKNLTLFFNYGLLLELYFYLFTFLLSGKIIFSPQQIANFSFLIVNTTQKYGGLARILGLIPKSKIFNDGNSNLILSHKDLQENYALAEQGMQEYAKQLTENE